MATNKELAAYKSGLKTRKNGKRHRKNFTIPVAVVAGFVPITMGVFNSFTTSGPYAGFDTMTRYLTGYSPVTKKWDISSMKCGTFAILLGYAVHWLVGGKLGVNRMLARTGIPIIRI